mmetsp:Transcript_52299/g.63037  ORF Transcript_52299/g.63037 Transcript_52299/m.63037 type:complete len:208 (-) Transcript_52299:1827-2450(-)
MARTRCRSLHRCLKFLALLYCSKHRICGQKLSRSYQASTERKKTFDRKLKNKNEKNKSGTNNDNIGILKAGKAGYNVVEGDIWFSSMDDCIHHNKDEQGVPLDDCFGINPSSENALFTIPTIYGESVENISAGTNANGNVVRFANRFRADEAVDIFAKNPPDAAYFGYTPYIDSRFDIDCEIRYKNNASLKASCGKRKTLFASLTDT